MRMEKKKELQYRPFGTCGGAALAGNGKFPRVGNLFFCGVWDLVPQASWWIGIWNFN